MPLLLFPQIAEIFYLKYMKSAIGLFPLLKFLRNGKGINPDFL